MIFNLKNGSVQIGAGMQASSALLQLDSTSQGFLIPRMDETERDAIISPAHGLMVFNTDANAFQWFDSTGPAWESIGGGSGPGTIVDGGNTTGAIISIGTNDDFALEFQTNGEGRFRIANDASTLYTQDSDAEPNINIRAGSGITSNANGGSLTFEAGSPAGDGGAGALSFIAGSTSGAGPAGGINISTGSSDGGNAGVLSIGTGNSVSGEGGAIEIVTGTGPVQDGYVMFTIGGQSVMQIHQDGDRVNFLDGTAIRLYDGANTNYVGLVAPATVSTPYSIVLPADPPAADRFLYYDGADYSWSPAGSGEMWTEYTVTHTDLQAAATTSNIELFSAPAGTLITAIVIKPTTVFTISGTYWLSIGLSGDVTRYMDEVTVNTPAVSDTNFTAVNIVDMVSFTGTTSVRIAARSSSGLLNTSTTGAATIWVRTVVLP